MAGLRENNFEYSSPYPSIQHYENGPASIPIRCTANQAIQNHQSFWLAPIFASLAIFPRVSATQMLVHSNETLTPV
jgi:hypothetical protein